MNMQVCINHMYYVLTIYINQKSRNIKIIAPAHPFYYQLPPPPPILLYSLNIPEDHFVMSAPILRYFSGTHTYLPTYN